MKIVIFINNFFYSRASGVARDPPNFKAAKTPQKSPPAGAENRPLTARESA